MKTKRLFPCTKLTPSFDGQKIIFFHTNVEKKPFDQKILTTDLKKLNLQRFIIRRGSKASSRDINNLPKFK